MADDTKQAILQLAENMKAMYHLVAEQERICVLLDNTNFFGAVNRIAKLRGWKFRVDYLKLANLLRRDRFVIDSQAFYKDTDHFSETSSSRDAFHALMTKAGFRLSGITTDIYPVSSYVKAEITRIADKVPRCDTLVLIAGDSCYTEGIEYARRYHGLKVEIAFFGTDTSLALRNAAFRFLDLEPIMDQIEFRA